MTLLPPPGIGRGGDAGPCLRAAMPRPVLDGALETGCGAAECCAPEIPAVSPGVERPCGDCGCHEEVYSILSGPLSLSGTTMLTSASPIVLDYLVDLGPILQRNGVIIGAQADYSCNGMNPAVTDNGGGPVGGSMIVTWGTDGLRQLNADLKNGFTRVRAAITFTPFGPPSATGRIDTFAVRWKQAAYPP